MTHAETPRIAKAGARRRAPNAVPTPVLTVTLTAALAAALGLVGATTPFAAEPPAADPAQRRHAAETQLPVLTKPAPAPSKTANPTLIVNEGTLERPLWIDSTRVAEFPLPGTGEAPALRPVAPGDRVDRDRSSKPDSPSAPGAKSSGAASTPVSPVFVDASGRPRALPGGVIVTLRGTTTPEAARQELEAAGLTPVRRIGERMWLVESAPGLAALELANRLHAEGRYEFVQPNWWNARTTK